jgi:hypothetical protein
MECPLDGTKFESWQDLSGTSFGLRLDFKQLGPIAQPWALAECPKCGLPLYQRSFSETEKIELKKVVAGDRFMRAAKTGNSYYALAVLQEERKLPPMKIAETYLQATWIAEEKHPETYRALATQAIRWYDVAAVQLAGTDDGTNSYLYSVYLPVELSRRIGEFAETEERINAVAKLNAFKPEWLLRALTDERKLAAAKDSAPHDMAQPKREPR